MSIAERFVDSDVDNFIFSVSKHLAGKHDQSTHGNGQAIVGLENEPSATSGKKLTAEEQDSLLWYIGDGYLDLNRHLRGLPSDINEYGLLHVAKLDSVMSKTKTNKDLTLTRLTDMSSIPKGLKAGDVITEKGFLSTSRQNQFGSSFDLVAENVANPVWLTIKVPKGSPAVDIGKLGITWRDEHEVLLPRDTKMRVLSVKDNQIEVEVVR